MHVYLINDLLDPEDRYVYSESSVIDNKSRCLLNIYSPKKKKRIYVKFK